MSYRQPSYTPQDERRRYSRDVQAKAVARMAQRPSVSPVPPGSTTTAGVDGSGNTYTQYPAIYDLDNYDEPAVVYYEGL